MKKERLVSEADLVVNKYIVKKATEALGNVEKEMHGEGCGCRQCKQNAVRDANSWVDFIAYGDQELVDDCSFSLEEKNGQLNIRASKSWKRSERL